MDASPSSRHRRARMRDVAELAKVSHQTVSRVINGVGVVAPETRERVLAAIKTLGYRPNSAARALVTQRSGLLGIISPAQSYFGPTSMQLGVELAAHDQGFLTILSPLEEFTTETLTETIGRFSSLSVEAIIIIEPLESILLDLERFDTPMPVVSVMSPKMGCRLGTPTATLDHIPGIRALLAHLRQLGHERIAHLRGHDGWYESREREECYRHEMWAAGLTPWVIPTNSWAAQSACEAVMGLPLASMPTAFFAASDDLALGAIHALQLRGIRVPEDVSVVGVDDSPSSPFLTPALTTVRQDFAAVGKVLVELALECIDKGEASARTIPVELILRDSTARARAHPLTEVSAVACDGADRAGILSKE